MNAIKPSFRKFLWVIRMGLILLIPPLLGMAMALGLLITTPFGSSNALAYMLGYTLSVCGGCVVAAAVYRGTTFEIGSTSVVYNMNFLWNKKKEVSLKNIKEVELKSGFLQKLFGLGTIAIHTQASASGNTKPGLIFFDIENSTKMYHLLKQCMSKVN